MYNGIKKNWPKEIVLAKRYCFGQKRLFWPKQRLFDKLIGFGQNLVSQMCHFRFWCFGLKTVSVDHYYRVTLVVEYLGWVDFDLGFSTILLGQ